MSKFFISILKTLIKTIKLIKSSLIKTLNELINVLVKLSNSLDKNYKHLLPLEMHSYDLTGRFQVFIFNNPNNLSGSLLIEALYNSLWNQKEYAISQVQLVLTLSTVCSEIILHRITVLIQWNFGH